MQRLHCLFVARVTISIDKYLRQRRSMLVKRLKFSTASVAIHPCDQKLKIAP